MLGHVIDQPAHKWACILFGPCLPHTCQQQHLMAQKLDCIYRYNLWQLHSVVPSKTWESSEMLTSRTCQPSYQKRYCHIASRCICKQWGLVCPCPVCFWYKLDVWKWYESGCLHSSNCLKVLNKPIPHASKNPPANLLIDDQDMQHDCAYLLDVKTDKQSIYL